MALRDKSSYQSRGSLEGEEEDDRDEDNKPKTPCKRGAESGSLTSEEFPIDSGESPFDSSLVKNIGLYSPMQQDSSKGRRRRLSLTTNADSDTTSTHALPEEMFHARSDCIACLHFLFLSVTSTH